MKNYSQKHHSHTLLHQAHHIYVSCVIAALLVICEHFGLFGWLDSTFLRVAAAIKQDNAGPQDNRIPQTLRIVKIDNTFFENEFWQKSPLDRSILQNTVNNIAITRPKTIVIDLDLSPGKESKDEAAAQTKFDEYLVQLIQNNKINVVLSTPFPVVSEELIKAKHSWMKRMCDGGVVFAMSAIDVEQSVAIKYNNQLPSLGNLTASIEKNGMTNPLCDLVKQGIEQSGFLTKEMPFDFGYESKEKRPLSMATFANRNHLVTALKSQYDTIKEQKSGETIFIGSGYNPNDEFLTPLGKASGVEIHAATYYSNIHKTENIGHVYAIILDIILGFICGNLFHNSWKIYFTAYNRFLGDNNESLTSYVKTKIILAINITLPILIMTGLIFSCSWLLYKQMWINPSPMVIGVLIKSILLSKDDTSQRKHNGLNQKNGVTIGEKAKHLILSHDLIFTVPTLCFSIYLLTMSH